MIMKKDTQKSSKKEKKVSVEPDAPVKIDEDGLPIGMPPDGWKPKK